MWQHRREFAAAQIAIVTVTFQPSEQAAAFAREHDLAWPLLIDEQRTLYRGYGFDCAGFWDIWGPATWWAYLRQLARGVLPKPSTGDVTQRGGDVLIDDRGIVRFHHVGKGPADRPTVKQILAARS